MLRRMAVAGDVLTSGGTVLLDKLPLPFTILDAPVALIGNIAYCAACKSSGPIAKSGGPRRWILCDRECALDGDIVLCACATKPRIVARLAGESWFDDTEYAGVPAPMPKQPSTSSKEPTYDEQFSLRDGNGRALAHTYYTVRMPSGSLVHGVTDSRGCTARYETSGAQSIRIYLGHKREA